MKKEYKVTVKYNRIGSNKKTKAHTITFNTVQEDEKKAIILGRKLAKDSAIKVRIKSVDVLQVKKRLFNLDAYNNKSGQQYITTAHHAFHYKVSAGNTHIQRNT